MKPWPKHRAHGLFVPWANKNPKYQVLLLLLAVMLCVFTARVYATQQMVVINKVLYNPSGSDNKTGEVATYEIVELKNISDSAVDVNKWEVRIGSYAPLTKITTPIPPGGKVIIFGGTGTDKNLDFAEGEDALLYRNKTGSQLGDSKGEIALYDSTKASESTIIDYVAYGKDFDFDSSTNFTHAKGANLWKKGDYVSLEDDGCAMVLKEKKNFDSTDWKSDCENTNDGDDGVITVNDGDITLRINEIFPNPSQKGEENEFIEIYNYGAEDILLKDIILRDRNKGECPLDIFSEKLGAENYLVVENKKNAKCKITVQNSKAEFELCSKENCDVSSIYKISFNESAKEDISFNYFSKDKWRWSKYITPGEENIFNNEPYGTVKIDDDIYVNVYADFSVSTGDKDGDKVKVTWDFGDGHKSYLAKVRHKYGATGTYNGSVKLSDGSEDVTKEFIVEVKKYPHPKIQIIEVKANPKGKDSEGETITVLNKSKKTLNLKGWSVATGAKKKLTNHPIKTDVKIKKKKTKVITKEMSKFSLNNKKGKIELRYPDGKVASKAKYDHGKVSIADDEVYKKTDGKWTWEGGAQDTNTKIQDANNIQEPIINNQTDAPADPQSLEPETSNLEPQASTALTPIEIPMQKYKIELAVANVSPQPQVLGAETVRETDGQYLFALQSQQQPHYAVTFFERIVSFLNSSFNLLLNKIF